MNRLTDGRIRHSLNTAKLGIFVQTWVFGFEKS